MGCHIRLEETEVVCSQAGLTDGHGAGAPSVPAEAGTMLNNRQLTSAREIKDWWSSRCVTCSTGCSSGSAAHQL
jgi:hypothetical protein